MIINPITRYTIFYLTINSYMSKISGMHFLHKSKKVEVLED